MELQTIVFDASTLILLAKVDLLQIVAEKVNVVIPREVKDEVMAKPQTYDAQLIGQMLKDGSISMSREVPNAVINKIQEQFRIDAGESAALFLAKENIWALGVDDGPAIRAAKIFGVNFVTAIHILIELHGQGIINSESAMAKLESLNICGRYNVQIIEDARLRIQKGR